MFKPFLHDVFYLRLRRVYAYVFRHFRRTYRYRVETTNAHDITEKVPLLLQSFWRTFINRKTILFYPDEPKTLFVIYKILLFLGYSIIVDASKNCDIAIKWRNAFDGNPFLPPEPALEKLTQTQPNIRILNMNCNDVSKKKVSTVFKETFGYSLSVDPQTHNGKCVMKSNWNGLHIGQIIECPMALQKDGFVYEKLIHNEVENGLVQDIRVPVFGKKIPFVYLKYRSIDDRLIDREHSNKRAVIAEIAEILSEEEVKKISRFCERMGLDYGEVDVLRDRDDGRIYIVDVNNNPAGPPSPISEDDSKAAIVRLARAFEETFAN